MEKKGYRKERHIAGERCGDVDGIMCMGPTVQL